MDKITWAKNFGFDSEDMEMIELALSFGSKIVAINDRPLDYEIIKYNK